MPLAETKKTSIPSRDEIQEQYKWNLSDIYEDDEKWEEDYKWVYNILWKYSEYQNSLTTSANRLLDCIKFDEEVGKKLEKLYLYAMLARDSDMRVSKYQGMDNKIKSLATKVSAAASFIKPEIIAIPDYKIKEMIANEEGLKIYKHFFDNLLRTKAHTLSKGEEAILAMAGDVISTPYNTFSLFTNADMRFPTIQDSEGNEFELSHARYYAAMYSRDRNFRKEAFRNYYKPYTDNVNTLSALFNGAVKGNIFKAKAKNYNSAREAALDKNNIPVDVYDNLIKSANENLKPMHRWGEMKKSLLKLDELHPYDVYVSIFEGIDKKYSYEEGKELVLAALSPLGDEYLNSIKKAFSSRWIDVYETESKRSGAYSSGTTYGVHPYVLLNWANLLNDVFTLAHEMGHNMHSYYTGLNQPYPYANYTIFLAEVASTFNESLLLDFMIENAGSSEEKRFLIEKYLNNITATFYRQTMFAEFEKNVYDIVESGEALTPEKLSADYRNMYQKYWGTAMIVDKEEEHTWARIPHFYYNFYVYQYATGYAASEILAKNVKQKNNNAKEQYLNFLKSGSSDYSINILKNAGVDMSSDEPIKATTRKMDLLIDELEKIV